ncbi:MAG: hypothetical protein WCK70_05025 [Chloroflexales bacterium]
MPLANAVANPIINDPFAEPGQHDDIIGDTQRHLATCLVKLKLP